MKAAFLLALFSGYLCLMTYASVSNFKKMVSKVTMKKYSSYSGYGCHCFLTGKGSPVDNTDRCCASHNCCYLNLALKGCKPRSDRYTITGSGRSVACAGDPGECARDACECDRTASLCLLNNKISYTDKYKNKLNFLCKGSKLAC